MKAVIVDIKGNYAAALTEEGSVVRINKADYTIGQKIEMQKVQPVRTRSLKRVVAIAAAAAMILSAGIGTAYAMPYGTVSLEADSEIEYTINRFDYVLKVDALNEKGEALLDAIGSNQLCHRSVDRAVAATMEQIEQNGLWDSEADSACIDAYTPSESHTERLQEKLEFSVGIKKYAGADTDAPQNAMKADANESLIASGSAHENSNPDMQPVGTPDGMRESKETAELPEPEAGIETTADTGKRNPGMAESDKPALNGNTPPLYISENAPEGKPPLQGTPFPGESQNEGQPSY